jgi:hypothetical protein
MNDQFWSNVIPRYRIVALLWGPTYNVDRSNTPSILVTHQSATVDLNHLFLMFYSITLYTALSSLTAHTAAMVREARDHLLDNRNHRTLEYI